MNIYFPPPPFFNHNFIQFIILILLFFFATQLNFIKFLFFLISMYLTLFTLFSSPRINIGNDVSFHLLTYWVLLWEYSAYLLFSLLKLLLMCLFLILKRLILFYAFIIHRLPFWPFHQYFVIFLLMKQDYLLNFLY